MSQSTPDYLAGNVSGWSAKAGDYVQPAIDAWNSAEPYWGIFRIPDTDLGLLPADMTGMRCIELGCGTAYVSAWMARRGAAVVGIDPTRAQLETARKMQAEHDLNFELIEGFAESVPMPDASFDFAISEYGAALWADPYAWIPEAARLLKPGGRLVFLSNSPLMVMCSPDYEAEGSVGRELLRPYFGMHKTQWPDAPGETEFHLPHGDWITLLRENGFVIERLVELASPADAKTHYSWADAEWGSQWPTEETWVVSKS